MAAAGKVFRSTAIGTPEADAPGTQRLPSTRTRVRLAPRLRSASCTAPAPMPLPSCGKPELPGTLKCELIAVPIDGSCCKLSPRFVRPERSRSSAVTSTRGAPFSQWAREDARAGDDDLLFDRRRLRLFFLRFFLSVAVRLLSQDRERHRPTKNDRNSDPSEPTQNHPATHDVSFPVGLMQPMPRRYPARSRARPERRRTTPSSRAAQDPLTKFV